MKDVSEKSAFARQKKTDLYTKVFSHNIQNDVVSLFEVVLFSLLGDGEACSSSCDHYVLRLFNEDVFVPYRVYCKDVDHGDWVRLSPRQRTILACLYTRHHDGYVREKYLRHIIESDELWVMPFIMLLLGDYVIEICDFILENKHYLDGESYRDFASENEEFMKILCSRIISYQHDGYLNCRLNKDRRRYKDRRRLEDACKTMEMYYPSVCVLKFLGLWDDRVAPNIIRNDAL